MLFNTLVIQSFSEEREREDVYDSTKRVFCCDGQTVIITHSVS